jgi:hypothetical protein
MKNLKYSLFVLLLACVTTFGGDVTSTKETKPTEESIKKLLEATKARKMVDDMASQMDGYLNTTMQRALKGRTVGPEETRVMEKMRTDLVKMLKEEMAWENYEPMVIRIYRDSLTQEEVDGMIAFYQTPAGQAMINKLPLVMKNMMAELQPMILRVSEKAQKIVEGALAGLDEKPAAKETK